MSLSKDPHPFQCRFYVPHLLLQPVPKATMCHWSSFSYAPTPSAAMHLRS